LERSIAYLGYLVGVRLLVLGNDNRYFIGVGSRDFQPPPTSRPNGVERVSALPPSIFRGGRRVHTKVCYNGIEKRGNIPIAVVLERRIGGRLHVHHMGEKDQVEKR
jgi:hypothetical protein